MDNALPAPGTFAEDALHGVYYTVTCWTCRYQRDVSAKAVTAAGFGHLQVVGSQVLWRCPSCKERGADLTLHGHWTGPAWSKPADWADTVEQRMTRPPVAALQAELRDSTSAEP